MRKKGKGRDPDAESHQLEYGDSRAYFSFQIYRKHQGFSLPLEIGNMRRKEGKEEDSAMLVRHRTDSATLTFLSVG